MPDGAVLFVFVATACVGEKRHRELQVVDVTVAYHASASGFPSAARLGTVRIATEESGEVLHLPGAFTPLSSRGVLVVDDAEDWCGPPTPRAACWGDADAS
jgi:hypothetical protein